MEFRILGPLEAISDRGALELGGTRQQIVLAILLLSAGRVVTMDRLVEAVYGERPPSTARSQVQIAISVLRRTLVAGGASTVISTHPQGYILRLERGQLDATRFADLIAAARAAADAGTHRMAVGHYREALRLWRGPALAGLDSDAIRLTAGHLDELRILASEERITLELEMGRHHEVLAELTELVAEFPLRERLREQLMLALYRCDRAADALEAYRDARRVLIDEVGIEPNERLRQMESAILAADPALDLPRATSQALVGEQQDAPSVPLVTPAAAVPRLLPADIADFTGRAKQIDEIHQRLLAAMTDEATLAVPIAAINGKGGIGKTSLAVHAAHGVAARFPDGQLFACLHGGSGQVSPAKVLDRFLRALGLTGTQVPETLEERAEAYRGLLADRRILVLLDDAASEPQVLPLLPGSPTSAVIITSRVRLAGLAGATHIDVDVFDSDKSVELLTRIAGSERVAAQAGAAAEVAELCGHLPLALRIAGARLSARRHWGIQQLVNRLSDEARRLDELRYGDMAIRASISLSYEGVSEQARVLLRRLAILELPAFSGWVTAALLDRPSGDAEDLVEELVTAQLIEAVPAGPDAHEGQYRFHDLIRLFARERLAAEEPADERMAALERVLGALLSLAEAAHRRHYGGDYVRLENGAKRWPLPELLTQQLVADPLSWYEHERATLAAATRQAAGAGLAELCWGLACIAVTLYESRSYLDDWRETHQAALEAVLRADNARGRAAILYSIGTLCLVEQRFAQARQNFTEAVRIFEDIGDEHGAALVIRQIAFLDRMSGRLDDAARHYERALPPLRASGDLVAVAHVLHGLAQVWLDRGEAGIAQELLAEALRLSEESRSGRIEAQVLHRMGEALLQAGRPDLATGVFNRALERVRDNGDLLGETYVLHGLGVARAQEGQAGQARSALDQALRLAQALGDRLIEARVLLALGDLALAGGNPAQASPQAERAVALFRDTATPLLEAQALAVLSRARAAMGDAEGASVAASEASRLRARE